jgi:hypothetical protein
MLKIDTHGRPFTERDRKLINLMLRPGAATLAEINAAIATNTAAWGYRNDSRRLAQRIGGTSWTTGRGQARRFGIRLPA